MAQRPRILVVDDDAHIVSSLRRALVYEGYDVQTAGDGIEGLARAREAPPDLVILDVMMPGLDGIEVCRRLRAEGEVAILMLTARDGTSDRVRGLDSGADDYLVKPFAYEELMARVRALLRRGTVRMPRLLSYSNLRLDLDTREVSRGDRPVNLTAKEHELLEHLLRQPRRVFTRDQLLEGVWGAGLGGGQQRRRRLRRLPPPEAGGGRRAAAAPDRARSRLHAARGMSG